MSRQDLPDPRASLPGARAAQRQAGEGTPDTHELDVPLSKRREWPGGFGNWNRWPNERGTLNLVTTEKVLQAARAVRSGRVYSCAGPLRSETYPAELQRLYNIDATGYEHKMYDMAPGAMAANDHIRLAIHRRENAHIDALSHVGHLGRGFDGVPFDQIVGPLGAAHYDASQMLGIVTRAILVDVPRLRGVAALEPGDSVTAEDLEAGAPHAEPGDALLVRTGSTVLASGGNGGDGTTMDPHGASAGMAIDAMSFIAERDVAVLGTDSTGDTYPQPHPEQPSIHAICEVYLGLPLLHGLLLEELAAAWHAQGRQDAMLCVASLHIVGGTGSPVTPLCVL